jgi:hypothetical protein
MQIAVPATPILTKGDHAANVGSYARHMRAENLPPAPQRTYLASLARLGASLEANGMPIYVASIRREHLEGLPGSPCPR